MAQAMVDPYRNQLNDLSLVIEAHHGTAMASDDVDQIAVLYRLAHQALPQFRDIYQMLPLQEALQMEYQRLSQLCTEIRARGAQLQELAAHRRREELLEAFVCDQCGHDLVVTAMAGYQCPIVLSGGH